MSRSSLGVETHLLIKKHAKKIALFFLCAVFLEALLISLAPQKPLLKLWLLGALGLTLGSGILILYLSLKKTLRDLIQREELFRLMAENLLDGLMIVLKREEDLHEITFVSPSFAHMRGHPMKFFPKKGAIRDLYRDLHPGDRERALAAVETALAEKKESARYAIRVSHARGGFIWREDHIRFVYDKHGNHLRSYLVGRDITQRMETEKQLRTLNAELEEKRRLAVEFASRAQAGEEAKSAFLANMSHELRTPLNGIMGTMELLRSTELDEEQEEYVEVARRSSSLLLQLISDVLDLSKIEAGKMVLEQIPFNLKTLMKEICQILLPEARRKALSLQVHLAPDLPETLRGDAGRLRQILLNLGSNALKFTPEGEVAFHVALCREPWGPDASGATLVFEVRDTGIGIDPKNRELLFQHFTQADSSTTRQYGGTGLGLAICRELAFLMGGTIEVDSAKGKGSTFRCTLPFSLSSSEKTAPTSPLPAPPPEAPSRLPHGTGDKKPLR